MVNLNEKATILGLSVEISFYKKWKEYVEKTSERQKDIVKKIVENPNDYTGFPYAYKGERKISLGLSVRLVDREKIYDMTEGQGTSLLMCTLLNGYMEKNPIKTGV